MTITVLEYDQGENEDAAAFLDFISSAAQAFSFINPVTATERAFTKEIAKTLLTLNKDDIVLRVSFDLVGDSGHLQAFKDTNGGFIPLVAGNYVLINQEGCASTTCFGYMSKQGSSNNPVAYLGDAVLAIPTAFRQGLTDTPDPDALGDIDKAQLDVEGQHVHITKPSKLGGDPNRTKYTDKTWLTLSIVQGGDPSLWDKRKLLLNAEEAVQRIGKSTGSAIQKSSDYDVALEALKAAKAQEHAMQNPVRLATRVDKDGGYTFSTAAKEICLAHPDSISAAHLQAHFYRLGANKPPELLAAHISPNSKTTPNNTCFDASPAAMTAGDYQIALFYPLNGNTQTQTLNYKVAN